MGEVKKSIEVEVPVSTAYNQWTQFEEFPQFMENVESVTHLDDTHLRWVAEIGGRREEWKAEITHQEPDSHIAWRSIEGQGELKTCGSTARRRPDAGPGRHELGARGLRRGDGREDRP